MDSAGLASAIDARVPVTVLTGFLGSGKTTLLNRILTERHGMRIAVIENEFGEVGIDQDLVIAADEEIFEMNNGCICCTVRGDLIRILGNLMRRKDRFDAVLIETTGLADPGPVVQTFFVDDEMARHLRLDAIVTMVDARHVWQHIDDTPEVQEQIAFADVILLNKADLVEAADLERLEQRVSAMNPTAACWPSVNADVPLDRVLGVEGFSLDRALELDPRFLEPEYPFEWSGAYWLPAGTHALVVPAGPDDTMRALMLRIDGPDASASPQALTEAATSFSAGRATGSEIDPSTPLLPGEAHALRLSRVVNTFPFVTEADGWWALFTEHHPDEFGAQVIGPGGAVLPRTEHVHRPAHEHDQTVASVGLLADRPLDLDRFNAWLGTLVRDQGPDIYRLKGVFDFAGDDRQFVVQGVHMLIDGEPGPPWAEGPRQSRMILIGRNLDREALTAGFASCLA